MIGVISVGVIVLNVIIGLFLNMVIGVLVGIV